MGWQSMLLVWLVMGFIAGAVRYIYWAFEMSHYPGTAKLWKDGLHGLLVGMFVFTIGGPISVGIVWGIMMDDIRDGRH